MIYYYAAISVDGYLAGPDQEKPVAWLDQFNEAILAIPDQNDPIKNSYPNMIKNTKTVIMGSTTYRDILGFDLDFWPYADMDSYVLTSKTENYQDENIKGFISMEQFKALIPSFEDDVFILGGGNLAGQLIDNRIIDMVVLTQMPILLGGGIPYFQNKTTTNLTLTRVEHTGDFIEMHYAVKK